MNQNKYKMSFTTGGLFRNESLKFIELYSDLKNWDLVSENVNAQNLLQARTISTLKRTSSEIIGRLKTFTHDELNLMIISAPQDQGYLLWLATCRRYKFIADFAVEVLRENYISLKSNITYVDFDSFFNQKSEWHDELLQIKPTTKVKLRQVLFKMLREADLLSEKNSIKPAIINPRLLDILSSSDLLYLPTFDIKK